MRASLIRPFAALSLSLVLAACGGDSDVPTPTLTPDAADDAANDATLDSADVSDSSTSDASDASEAAPDAGDSMIDAETDVAPDVTSDGASDGMGDAPPELDADAGSDAADAADAPAPLACETGAPITIRLVAGNVSSGNGQSYDPGHGGRILKALRPDVTMIQEFNFGTNSTADLQGFVDRYFGVGTHFARGTGQIPNGVITRFPILASGEWTDASVSNRGFVWARVDIPGDRDLFAVSVHLLTSSSGNRNAEATQLSNYLKANVTDGSFIVVAGDFNTDARTEPALSSFASVVVTSGPWPADQSGNGNTNANRNKPYDWVVVSPSLEAMAAPLAIGSVTVPTGLVFDTRVFTPLAPLNAAGDPDAVLASDSAAPSMQHMAVARDFAVACP